MIEEIEIDEDERLRRIKIIYPELYEEIVEIESKLYLELSEKMDDIRVVKDMILEYQPKQARRLFDNLLKNKDRP